VAILNLLEPFGPAEAVPALAPYVDRGLAQPREDGSAWNYDEEHDAPVWQLFKDCDCAASALGNIAQESCVAALRKAMRDEDLLRHALSGTYFGIKAGRATPAFAQGIFSEVERLLPRTDNDVADLVPSVLLGLDPVRSLPILLSPRHWHIDNERNLRHILEGMLKRQVNVPDDRLLELEQSLWQFLGRPGSAAKADPPRNGGLLLQAYWPLLTLLVRQKTPGVHDIIARVKKVFRHGLADDLAKIENLLYEVADPFEFIKARVQEVGEEGLTEKQRMFYIVDNLHFMGFEEFYMSMPDEAETAPHDVWQKQREDFAERALKAIGSRRGARLFRKVNACETPEEVQQLHKEFCEGEDVPGLLRKFAAKHPQDFGRN
jgi:hypothetical protein